MVYTWCPEYDGFFLSKVTSNPQNGNTVMVEWAQGYLPEERVSIENVFNFHEDFCIGHRAEAFDEDQECYISSIIASIEDDYFFLESPAPHRSVLQKKRKQVRKFQAFQFRPSRPAEPLARYSVGDEVDVLERLQKGSNEEAWFRATIVACTEPNEFTVQWKGDFSAFDENNQATVRTDAMRRSFKEYS